MTENIRINEILDCVYCKRRWYLHNIELSSNDNYYIIDGKEKHKDVDKNTCVFKPNGFDITNVAVYNPDMNLYGICDMIHCEYDEYGVITPYSNKPVVIKPIEYKHGKLRNCLEYKAQCVAQAMCLEYMFNCQIQNCQIYFIDDKSYMDIQIDESLRQTVISAIEFIKTYCNQHIDFKYSRKCKNCSMYDICSPRELNIQDYMRYVWSGDGYEENR